MGTIKAPHLKKKKKQVSLQSSGFELGLYTKWEPHTSRILVGYSEYAVGWSEDPIGTFSIDGPLMNLQFELQRWCSIYASSLSCQRPIVPYKMHNTLHHYGLYSKTLPQLYYSYRWRQPAIFQTLNGDLLHFSYLNVACLYWVTVVVAA